MDFINKLPSWLRWILTPIASLASMFLSHWVTQIIAGLYGNYVDLDSGGFIDNILRNTFAPAATCFFSIYVGVLFAPSYKKAISLVFGALYILMLSLSLQSQLEVGNIWGIINVICSIVGLGLGIYYSFEEGATESV